MKSFPLMSALLLMNMLEKIQSRLEHLSKSERKVAEVILATPEQAIHSSIAALALEAGVSEPTVNRFCRSLETRGFPDFKLHLAQSLAHGTLYVNRNVDEDDSVESYTGKIFESAMASLDQVHHSLDMSAVNRAVDLLTQAKKIAFFGLGSSAAVAHDAMNKFFRFRDRLLISIPPRLLDKTNYPITLTILFSERQFLTYRGFICKLAIPAAATLLTFTPSSPVKTGRTRPLPTLTACQRIPFSPAGAMSLPPAITYLHPAAVNWTASGSSLTPAAHLPSMHSG